MNNRDLVLITGGSGFIGRNLVRELSRNKELQVFSVDLTHEKSSEIDDVQYIDCDCELLRVRIAGVHTGNSRSLKQNPTNTASNN